MLLAFMSSHSQSTDSVALNIRCKKSQKLGYNKKSAFSSHIVIVMKYAYVFAIDRKPETNSSKPVAAPFHV